MALLSGFAVGSGLLALKALGAAASGVAATATTVNAFQDYNNTKEAFGTKKMKDFHKEQDMVKWSLDFNDEDNEEVTSNIYQDDFPEVEDKRLSSLLSLARTIGSLSFDFARKGTLPNPPPLDTGFTVPDSRNA